MRRRLWLNLGLLIAGVASAGSGLTLQIRYHMHLHGHLERAGWGYPIWAHFHKVTSVALLALVAWHLFLNWKWLRIVWTKGLFHKHKQLVTMSTIFLFATLTGMGAWIGGWIGLELLVERLVVEIHDKITLLLTVFLLLHVWSRRRRLAG